MKRTFTIGLVLLAGMAAVQALAAPAQWVEGRNYVRLDPVQHTSVPAGKIEVMEVFSYGCPACNQFQPVIEKLKRSLPPTVQMVFLPASFSQAEDWPMFQRAYFAAQSLGIADRSHQAMFDAVWKTGELAIADPATHRLKYPLPTIEDAAHCYARLTGVRPEAFVAAARSFTVDTRIRQADAQIKAMDVPSTPCFIVNGKYRIITESLNSVDDVLGIVEFLVAKESAGAR